MRILVLGDFHGKFPRKIKEIVEKEKIEAIISLGDYCPFIYRKLWFELCYHKEEELWEIIGKKRTRKLVEKDLRLGEKVLKELNKIGVPVFTVVGNLDYSNENDVFDYKQKNHWEWYEQDFFSKIIKKYKNIKRFDYDYVRFKEIVFIGAYGHTFPGRVKSKAFRRHRKMLERLFKRFRKENKLRKVIFVSHNVSYNTKLDKITSDDAHKKVKGKHYGSKLIRKIIDKYQPVLSIGGHIHEGKGIDKIGKTICLNPGAVHDNEYAVVEFDEKKGKVGKIRFIG